MKNDKHAFTLIELLVVVLIIGILAAVAVPQYRVAVQKTHLASYMHAVDALYNAQQAYYLANGHFATDIDALDISMPIDENCTRATVEDTTYAYRCTDIYWGLNAQRTGIQISGRKEGSSIWGVMKMLIDYDGNAGYYEKGKTYCMAKPGDSITERACQTLGGKYFGATDSWIYYVLPS